MTDGGTRTTVGRALDWSEDDLDELSAVTPRDQKAAREWFRQHAPAGYRTLLEAEMLEPDA